MVQGMIQDLKENTPDWTVRSQVRAYLEDILDKKAFDKKGLIYGMGHAVYTMSDPRSELLKKQAEKMAKEKGMEDEFNLLKNVEELTQELFFERRGEKAIICANVDLYSGLVYEMLGISEDLFTPIFAVARSAGWCAHRMEQVRDERIIRPAYVNLVKNAKYLPLEDRD